MAQCKRHPSVETNLFCSKCEAPICPRCMVQTPVGMRCPTCARLNRVPTYKISGKYYLRGGLAAAGLAVAVGFLWLLIRLFVPYISFFNWAIAAGAGYAIGEGISRATNRKAGTPLIVLGVIAVLVAFLISSPDIFIGFFRFFSLIDLAVGIFVAVARLR
jgi:hypothetical protein